MRNLCRYLHDATLELERTETADDRMSCGDGARSEGVELGNSWQMGGKRATTSSWRGWRLASTF